MIRINGIRVSFGGVCAIEALDAELVAPIVGLIGPNGSGKTTLLNVLSGFVTPVSGRVILDGQELLGLSPVDRVKCGLRRTFQQEQVVEELSIWENVQAIADYVASAQTARAEIQRAIAFVGLAGNESVPGVRLNLFQRRMVDIAKTLIGRPKAILLDEPGAGLDEIESRRLLSLLRDIPRHTGAQLVIIDHDADLISSLCVETMVLDFGRLLAYGPTRAVLDDPVVRRAYLGSE